MTFETIHLTDPATGSTAKILPRRGFNCYSFQAAPAGKMIEVLWADLQFTSGATRAARSGIPILFPFAGRLRGTSFRYAGRQYDLEVGDDFGNAIHGFVIDRPWRVIEQSESSAVGQFHASLDDSSLLAHWPADFRITVSYRLTANTLQSDIVVDNPSDRPLPFGLGTHGYFRVPLGGQAQANDCRVSVPVSSQWELVKMLPTGRRIPAEGGQQLTAGARFEQMQYDHVFTGLAFDGAICTSTVQDPVSGRTMTLTFDDQFANCVVFIPPHREAVCIEPYTTGPDAFALLEQGVDPGLVVLPPGESWRTHIEMRLD